MAGESPMSERRTELSEKATVLLDRAITKAFKEVPLKKLSGPADRYGTTEWTAFSAKNPDHPDRDVRFYVSMAAWPAPSDGEFSVMLQCSAAVRTHSWVVRSTFPPIEAFVLDTNRLLFAVLQVLQGPFTSGFLAENIKAAEKDPENPPHGGNYLVSGPLQGE
jgi:hypothetical protein